MTGAWRELVKAAMPKPPFTVKLFDFLQRGMGGDSTFDHLDRRWLHAGIYLPSDMQQVMGEVVVILDTSGSMSNKQLQSLGYIRSFREQHPCRLHLIQCDHDVPEGVGHTVYEEHDPLPATFEVHGRGGTSFDPPFALMRERNITPRIVIYLTDGYGKVHEKPPACPVLWVIVEGGDKEFAPGFGEVCVA